MKNQAFLKRLVIPAVVLASACGGADGGTGPLAVSANVSLGPTEYTFLKGAQIGGAVRFPAADAAGAQYLVVAQFATGITDVSTAVRLTSGDGLAPSVVAGAPEYSLAQLSPGPAAQFHDRLRAREREFTLAPRPAELRAAPRAPQPPPTVGQQRTFKVCGNLDCTTLVGVPATAKYVGARAAIFLDDSVPAGGFSQADLDELGAEFDSTLYPIGVAAFGSESDIDLNSVVIILLTRKVNTLVGRPDCEDAFVTGYFYGADLAPGYAEDHNNGEVFYGFVPDPGSATTCAYTLNQVRALLPVTFSHEFQHMISFNQHYLVRRGPNEVMWLNEAMSHLAEELVGLHYDSLGQSATASTYLRGNFYNAYQYLVDPNASVMVSDEPPGELASRGGAWLFLRYVADRYGMDAIRDLSTTAMTGAANVTAATGADFADLVGRWALAVYVSDLPGFTAPAALRYELYSLREKLASPFPLVPAVGNPLATVQGTVASGSGMYAVLTQPANGASFDITFRSSNGGLLPPTAAGQLAIVRIR